MDDDVSAASEGAATDDLDGETPHRPDRDFAGLNFALPPVALFRKTSSRNQALEARVEELERELHVWKVALKAAEDEKAALVKKAARLERNIGALKDDNPLMVCLIDGDGNIFSSELLAQGHAGGRRAAALLTQGLNEHVAYAQDTAGRAQLWLTVYCNKRGLAETLVANGVCSTEQFEDFVLGFNQAAPLFSFVDVGGGKEAADSKIKECLRVFTRFPQTFRVFFGGAHDNGYTTTLNHLHNEGLHEKLVILRGYKELASEVKSLNLPQIDIEGVFMTEKLPKPAHGHNHNSNYNTPFKMQLQAPQASPVPGPSRVLLPTTMHTHPTVKVQDFDKFRTNKVQDKPTEASPQGMGFRTLVPNMPLHKQRPPPCNFFYLKSCKHGTKCRYAHDYILHTEHIEELRTNSKKWPCPYANRSKQCPHEPNCPMAHTCPHGSKCSFAKSNKCKFIAKGMHDATSPDGSTWPSQGPSSIASTSPLPSPYSLSMSPTPPDDSVDVHRELHSPFSLW